MLLRPVVISISTAALASAFCPRKSSSFKNTCVVRSLKPFCVSGIQVLPLSLSQIRMNNNDGERGDNDNSYDEPEPDLFDYFDPLLSPHAYPDGISPNKGPKKTPLTEEINKRRDKGPPVFGFRLDDVVAAPAAPKKQSTPPPQEVAKQRAVVLNVFDPLLSPHAYPTGTPDKVIDDEEFIARAEGKVDVVVELPVVGNASPPRVGILFIDHGSRNDDSNHRLHEIARIYQEQFYKNQPNVVVRAAHMEIANPSIPEALQSMIEETKGKLDEIICHPFFLSPLGRHVSKDIPEIIEGFKKESSIDIPITTTEPVGAEINIMMQAVHSLVMQSTTKIR